MEAVEVFKSFAADLQTAFSDIVHTVDLDTDNAVKHIETEFFPQVVKILQKDNSFFTDAERVLFGINLSQLWKVEGVTVETREAIWKHLQMCMFASFLHGDIKDKVGTIFSTVKSLWTGKNDEISNLLNNEASEGRFKEILDYVLETRIVKIFMEIVEHIDITELDLNVSDPQKLMEVIKNPEHPSIKKIITKIQGIINDKIKSGQITQHQLISEIEAIKAKSVSMFGNVFNDALGGRRSDTSASALLSHSPEARRQRMLARLQKKQRDKNSS